MTRKMNKRSGSTFEALESRQLMAAGDLDPTFGVGGKIIADTVGFPIAEIAVQKDGKVIAVGSLNKDFAIARLNANGKLDRSFGGGDGVATADFGGNRGDRAAAVAIQADGKIVVGGVRDNDRNTIFGTPPKMAVARFNADGSLDKTFDGNGMLTIDFSADTFTSAIAVQPNGRILIAGRTVTTGALEVSDVGFAVARVMPDGSVDRSFGQRAGSTPNSARTGRTRFDFTEESDVAHAIALAPDGKILVGGNSDNDKRFAVARLNADGTFDKSFGDGISGEGRFGNLVLGNVKLRDLDLQPDGSVLFVGESGSDFAVGRLTPAGRLDRTLNGSGHVEFDMGGKDSAAHVRVSREGILVAGASEGKFALARVKQNGALDATFGKGGKVVTAAKGNGDSIRHTTLTSDGKILAFGASGSVARYVSAVPKVNVFSLDPSGKESDNGASLIFTRDQRLSFPTRVFFNIAGTATPGSDFTGLNILPQAGSRDFIIIGGGTGTLSGGPAGFVDIPANETFVNVPISVINDSVREATESIEISLKTNANYALGDRPTQTLDVIDNDLPLETLRFNFQASGTSISSGPISDLGGVFAQRGNMAYGWDVDNTANARIRGNTESPDFRYDSLNHMQKNGANRFWEVAIPNGTYMVRLVAGDPSNVDSVYRMNLEGRLALSGTPSGDTRFFRQTTVVQVNDGRLTLSNADGAVNNRINFIEIKSVAPRTKLGKVSDVAVRLKNAATANIWQKQANGLFSDNQIDEKLWV